MDTKDRFDMLIKESKFKSRREFALAAGISYQGLENNLVGRFGLSVERAFQMANTFKVPVDIVFEVFYPELIEENRRICCEYNESNAENC